MAAGVFDSTCTSLLVPLSVHFFPVIVCGSVLQGFFTHARFTSCVILFKIYLHALYAISSRPMPRSVASNRRVKTVPALVLSSKIDYCL